MLALISPDLRPVLAVALAGILGGCAAPDDSGLGDTADTADTGAPSALDVPEWIALPAVVAGGAAPSVVLELGADASVRASGPFAVEGDGPWTIRFTGDTSEPGWATGELAVTAAAVHRAGLSAVVTDDLPEPTWVDEGWLSSAIVALPSAPYPEPGGAWDDPSVLIAVPHGLSTLGGVRVVTHLHGHNASLSHTPADQYLLEQHALSGRDAVFVMPQGPVQAASGDFGKLMDPGGHAALVRDVIAVLYREGLVLDPTPGAQVLTSHSGGYRATAAIVEQGGLDVDAVHLFDSLYGELDAFQTFAEAGGVLRSNYTASGGTLANNQTLAAALTGEGDGTSDAELAADRVTVAYTPSTHGACIHDHREYARWLVHSGLPPHPVAPPELLSVVSHGTDAVVTWREHGLPVRVERSADGVSWASTVASGATATIPAAARVRVVADGGSEPSDTYGGTGSTWLVVDGFDRVLHGSWSKPTHRFAATVGAALSEPFSTASNEAVVEGRVDLADYDRVLWLLGDEGVADDTFDAAERAVLEAYVAGGGELIVSGSEVGYATPSSFLETTLHAGYVADDAGTDQVGNWTFGVAYPEDYPDVLSGDTVLWTYATGGAAAVGWANRIVVVGFPLETLDAGDLAPALAELVTWLDAG